MSDFGPQQPERPPFPSEGDLRHARLETAELRTSHSRSWREVREKLSAAGLDVRDVAVATSFPDDTNVVFGVIVARNGRRFTFTFEYPRKPPDATLEQWLQQGWLWQWEEQFGDSYKEWGSVGHVILDEEAPREG